MFLGGIFWYLIYVNLKMDSNGETTNCMCLSNCMFGSHLVHTFHNLDVRQSPPSSFLLFFKDFILFYFAISWTSCWQCSVPSSPGSSMAPLPMEGYTPCPIDSRFGHPQNSYHPYHMSLRKEILTRPSIPALPLWTGVISDKKFKLRPQFPHL